MEEIKVGEYVRTSEGNIGKVYSVCPIITDEAGTYYKYILEINKELFIQDSDEIISHSKNIINLIEVGDYINGSKLIAIDYAEDKYGNRDKLHFYYEFEDCDNDINEYYEHLVINDIVTKEQFKHMKYEVNYEN